MTDTPNSDDERKEARAETIRGLFPKPSWFPIESVHLEAVNLHTGPEVVLVVNRGRPTETQFCTDELSNAIVSLMIHEARDALQRRAVRPVDPHAAMPARCALCGLGPEQRPEVIRDFVSRATG